MAIFTEILQYLQIKDIDFTSARGIKQKLDDIIDGCDIPKEVHKTKEDTTTSK